MANPETEDRLDLKTALDSVTTRPQSPALSETELEKLQRQGWEKWLRLSPQIGARYQDCKLGNFVLSKDDAVRKKQEAVITALEGFAKNMISNVSWGMGIILYGPAGTGKDHLLSAMMRAACRVNLDVAWRNGMDLYADRRDAISQQVTERELITSLIVPHVLAISDPVPPWGSLTEGQAEFLFRVVDARYRRRLPVWVSANFAAGNEAEGRVGIQVIDRLRDGSLALHCNWPSYRKNLDQ